MNTFFTVTAQDLNRLSPDEAVQVFRELLWAEATSIGLARSLVTVPSAITVADGGVDAEVENAPVPSADGLIRRGKTRYQIKTGPFTLTKASNIKEILLSGRTGQLKPRIKSCLDAGHNLCVVLFGWDGPEHTDNQLTDAFLRHLVRLDAAYGNARVTILRPTHLIGFLRKYPSLALHVNRRDHGRFETYGRWARHDDMVKAFVAGQAQATQIDQIRQELRRDQDAIHVRVLGEPGIGKTKMVLEACSAEDLAPLVLYCDSPAPFLDSDLMNELLKEDNEFRVLLVLDECDHENRAIIWNKFRFLGPRFKLVSLYSDWEDTTGAILYVSPEPLDDVQISMIIQSYGVPGDVASRWVEFCTGSPRVAHVFGLNLRSGREDLLASPDTVRNVWDRFVSAGEDPASEVVRQRRLVLEHVALFKRFGFEKRLSSEAKAIAAMVADVDPSLTWPRFCEIVQHLRARKVLQGEVTLYITPKALHVKLWVDWWNKYGNTFDFSSFTRRLPAALVSWFYGMFKYARESGAALQTVKELLALDGPFGPEGLLSDSEGSRLFLALTEADPEEALRYLTRTVGTWTDDRLLRWDKGRREAVWALRRIAIWKDLFQGAARLLLRLAENENERWANNSTGVFAELFSPGYGPVAPTEAAPEERFPVLREALASASARRRKIAIEACDQALESHSFSRSVGPEYQGLRLPPKLWKPSRYGELFDAYRRVWQLLADSLKCLPEEERAAAARVLLKRARGLGRIQALTDLVIGTLDSLGGAGCLDKKELLTTVVRIIHYDAQNMPQETLARWVRLRDSLTGAGYADRMRRYVGMSLLEDKVDEEGKTRDAAKESLEQLANESLADRSLLSRELGWLVTSEAKNGHRFGYILGQRDEGLSSLRLLLDAQRNAGAQGDGSFLGGYFRALRERDASRWEEELDVLARDEGLRKWVPEVTWRSGLSERAAVRILDLADTGAVQLEDLHMFAFGGLTAELAEPIFLRWVQYLLVRNGRGAIRTALDFVFSYYIYGEDKSERRMPEDLTLNLLTHPAFFSASGEKAPSDMEAHTWSRIAERFILLYPCRALDLATKMLEHLGEDGTIVDLGRSESWEVLDKIAERQPTEVWTLANRYLDSPADRRCFYVIEWLRGSTFDDAQEGAISKFPQEQIWAWVEKHPKERAARLAELVPKVLSPSPDCLARELLVRYGTDEDVRDSLTAYFWTGGWTGPESLHYGRKKQFLLDFKRNETNGNVLRWIDDVVADLNVQIEKARTEEERRGF